jgi:cytochrome P450
MTLFYPRPQRLPPLTPGIMPPLEGTNSGETTPNGSYFPEHPTMTPDILKQLSAGDGAPVAFLSGRGLLHYLFTSPSDVVSVLVDNASSFMKGDQEAAFSAAVGWGLLVEEGPTHKAHQAAIGPAFRAAAMDNYFGAVDATARDWIDRMMVGEPQPLLSSVRELTQESAERALFLRDSPGTNYGYHDAVFAIGELVLTGSQLDRRGPDTLVAIRSYTGHRDVIEAHVQQLVSEWRRSPHPEHSLMSYLDLTGIDSEEGFGPLHHQVSMFLQAAVETTASLISWVLLLLANNPDYWSTLYEESTAEGTKESGEFAWHNAVINEALRLYPPAWMIPRVATEDVQIGGATVPKGARVVVSPWVTHRSAYVFDEPEEFRPERWMDPERRVERGGYFPFGLGTRICIGERYGKMTATRLLTHLTRSGIFAEIKSPDLSVGSSALIANPHSELEFRLVTR